MFLIAAPTGIRKNYTINKNSLIFNDLIAYYSRYLNVGTEILFYI